MLLKTTEAVHTADCHSLFLAQPLQVFLSNSNLSEQSGKELGKLEENHYVVYVSSQLIAGKLQKTRAFQAGLNSAGTGRFHELRHVMRKKPKTMLTCFVL